jgi:hypothetical protein
VAHKRGSHPWARPSILLSYPRSLGSGLSLAVLEQALLV